MSLSQNIKRLRIEKGLTQEQLASAIGVSPQAVSKWETTETYPDGTLLVPLAQALGTSLDMLFGNTAFTMKDLSSRIRTILSDTPEHKRFHVIRDICWQVEKGLFNCYMAVPDEYSTEEIRECKHTSYIDNDYGFTYVSNDTAPFFSVFPKYENTYTEAIRDGEKIRKIFDRLSSPEIMRAVLFIHSKENRYLFDSELLAAECSIAADKIEVVIDTLIELHLVIPQELEIDGKVSKLFCSEPSLVLIAMFLIADQIDYDKGYRYQSEGRNKPFLT